MRKATLVRGARQLLTLRGPSGPRRGTDLRNLGIIQDGAVLIADGLIREVGPSRRLENLALARGAEEIDASGCVVMPGFVDSHVHLAGGPARVSDYEMRLGGATEGEIAQAGAGRWRRRGPFTNSRRERWRRWHCMRWRMRCVTEPRRWRPSRAWGSRTPAK